MARDIRINLIAKEDVSGSLRTIAAEADKTSDSLERAGSEGAAGLDQVSQAAAKTSQSLESSATSAGIFGSALLSAVAAPMGAGTMMMFNQVRDVERATRTLIALEPDIGKVRTELEALVSFARSPEGRLFMREELFGFAQALKAAGVETERLAEYTTIASRSVTIGLGDWNELERVITRVGRVGNLTSIDWEMLTKMGFDLDASLRNQAISWEELFDVLDQGIDSSRLEVHARDIDSLFITAQSSVRDLGALILQVDRDTSQFIEGGLGDTFLTGLEQGRELMISMQPAAQAAGEGMAFFAQGAGLAVELFLSLPSSIQTTIFALLGGFGALTVGASATVLAFSKLSAAGAATMATFRALGGVVAAHPILALITVVGGIGLSVWAKHRSEVQKTAATYEELQASAASADEALRNLRLAGDVGGANLMQGIIVSTRNGVKQWTDELNQAEESWGSFVDSIYGDQEFAREFTQSDFFEGVVAEYQKLSGVSQEIIDEMLAGNLNVIEGHLPGLAEAMSQFYQAYLPSDGDRLALEEEINELFTLIANPNIDANEVFAEWNRLYKEYVTEAELPNFQGFIAAWNEYESGVVDSIGNIVVGLDGLTEAQRSFNLEMAQMRLDGDGEMVDNLLSLNQLLIRNSETSAEAGEYMAFLESNVRNGNIAIEDLTGGLTYLDQLYRAGLISQQEYDQGVIAVTNAVVDQTVAQQGLNEEVEVGNNLVLEQIGRAREHALAKVDEAEAYQEYLDLIREVNTGILELTGNASLLNQLNLAGFGNEATLAAQGINDAAAGLDTVYRVVVGNTDAIGRQVDGVEGWAEALIGVQGEYSKLDELVAAGRITGVSGVFDDGSQYAQAQQAYNDILEDNAAIQEHILTIQAQQAPMIAANVSAMEEYIGAIADMNDGTVEGQVRQMEALAWMDQGLQGQAAQTLELVSHLQTLGPEGEQAFRAMADSAAATNPYLFTMYETLGLVTDVVRDEDGRVISYEVDLGGADGAMSEIALLTESITALTDMLYTIFIDGENQDALDAIWTVETELENLDGETATVSINLLDNATNGINAAMSALLALDGSSATTTIRTIYDNRGIGPAQALGGMVREYAGGGVLFRAGEQNRPEIAHFATGGTALIPRDGYYTAPAGTYISPNNAVSNSYGGDTVFNITVNGVEDQQVVRVFTDDIIPRLERAVGDRRVGMGGHA